MTAYDLVAAAKEIRKTLKAAFPTTTFKVRTERYSGGKSTNITWLDGPTIKQVKDLTDYFQNTFFDGQTDSESHREGTLTYNGEPSTFNCGYVFEERRYTKAFLTNILAFMAEKMGRDLSEFVPTDDGEYGSNILNGMSVRLPFRTFVDYDTQEVTISSCDWDEEYLSTLVHQVAAAASCEPPQGENPFGVKAVAA